MESDRGSPAATSAVGLCLLPSELIHEILLRLSLPDLLLVRSVSRTLSALLVSPDFRQLYSPRYAGPCLFVLSKRFPRDPLVRAFHRCSPRWLRLPLPYAAASEDPYLLAATGDHLVFASNTRRGLLALNLAARSLAVVPPSPLGPRRTSSWRRSSLKLVSEAGRFRFLFAELVHDRPFLFEYLSDTGTWRSSLGAMSISSSSSSSPSEQSQHQTPGIWLHLVQSGSESVILRAGGSGEEPTVLRTRFREGMTARDGLLQVHGDGNVAVVRSTAVEDGARAVIGVEVWGVAAGGEEWELVSRVPEAVIEGIRQRPYGAMMGCLEESEGVIRVVLVANLKGNWDITWLVYDRLLARWVLVPVPEEPTASKGLLNMAGLAVSSSFSALRLLL